MPINNNYDLISTPNIQHMGNRRDDSYFSTCNYGRLERTPRADKIDISKKKSPGFLEIILSCLKKTVKNNEIKRVNEKYADLINRLPEVQKTFQEVFMRDNLTEKETLEMLKDYHKTELVRINGTPEEYAKALFEVALKNYELDHGGIKLRFDALKNTNAVGNWHPHTNTVSCKSGRSAEDYFSTIHHELRHAKQTQSVVENLSDEEYTEYFKRMCYRCAKDDEHLQHIKSYEEFEEKVLTPDFLEITMKTPKGLARKNPPRNEQTMKFAQIMHNAAENYKKSDEDMEGYWNADNEKDARFAELQMLKLFGQGKKVSDFYEKMDRKYLK